MKLLAGTDGSPAAAAALRWAAALAVRLHADLAVAHVYAADPNDPSSWDDAHEKARARLDQWCEPARSMGIGVETVLLDGETGPALLAAASERDVDLVIVSRRGQGGFEGLLVGGTADHVAHHSHQAIAVLPPDVDPLVPAHVLLGVDGSEGSDAALAWVAQHASSLGTKVTAVYVPLLPDLQTRLTDAQHTRAEEALAAWTRPLHDAGVDLQRRVVAHRHPADALITAANEAAADAVVVGTRALGGLRFIRLGGVTMQLLHHCPHPVIAVPAAT